MTKKVITSASGSAQTIYYENSEDNTVVKFNAGGKTITAHSKTDSFGRKVFDELQLGTGFVSRQFSYLTGIETEEHKQNGKLKSSPTTQLVSQIVLSGGRTISYEYDEEERITKVDDSVDGITTYTYDALGQLVTEMVNGITTKFEYDNYGNIKAKGVVDETGEIAEETKVTYVYGDDTWKDLLIAYNGQSITYDAQGNPISYLGHTLTWEKGRQLKSFDNIQYTYNANGIRTSKTVGGIRHDFVLDGAKILREAWNYNETTKTYDDVLVPLYDNEDSVCGIEFNNTAYYFLKNLQGDIIAITNGDGDTVARYSYDAWGVPTIIQDFTDYGIASINPYRYRGYYYDEETGLYYVSSRYYDPEIGRWINADEATYLGASGTNLGFNLFAYCENNPVTNIDPDGHLVITTTMLICAGIGALVLGTIGGFAGYYISKKMNVPKGSRWKYVVGGALIGAVVGAAAGFGLGYCIGGGSVVAVVGKSGTAISTKALKLGNKLRYVFGKATGSAHNIKRSKSMYSLLKKIGIWDNKFGNEYLTKCIIEIYKNATPYVSKGKLVREAMLYGPGGGVMLQTIWEGTKLITVYIFG